MLGRLDHRLYSSHSDLNATDQYYEGTGKYAFTPRLNLSGKALYSRGFTSLTVILRRPDYY